MIRIHLALLGLLLSRLQVRTNAGRDHQARVMGDNASNATSGYASGCYIALSGNADAPSAANTALPGEITTGTLARAQAIYAHTNGTNIYTLTKTFTSDQTVTVTKLGVYNAASGGTLIFESLLDAPVNLRSGDQVQITEAVTI